MPRPRASFRVLVLDLVSRVRCSRHAVCVCVTPIVGDDLINQNVFLVGVVAMILMGGGVVLGIRRWRAIPLSALIALNIIGPASVVLLLLVG
jgi:hypothetical protein